MLKLLFGGLVAAAALSGVASETPSDTAATDADTSNPTISTQADTAASNETESEINPLSVENCPELAAALSSASPSSPEVISFFRDHIGDTIEFDGNVAACSSHEGMKTRFDYLVHAGDYSTEHVTGPEMQFKNVAHYNLHTTMDVVPVGCNIHIVATIKGYDGNTDLVQLDPVAITAR